MSSASRFRQSILAGVPAVVLGLPSALGSPAAGEESIKPANPNASEDARRVLKYLYNLPCRSVNRLITGHMAGGAIGPTAPKAQDGGYRFKLREIEYLHDVSGQWVGLIGAEESLSIIITH